MTMDSSTTLGAPAGSNRNARLAHIRKFVCVPPERGHTLRLVAIEDPPTVLGEWPRAACEDNAVTAEEVDARLREHATTNGIETIANLTWTAESALVVTTKRLRCKPESSADLSDPASLAQAEALGIDGTNRGQAIQLGRALEGSIRMYMSAHQTQVAQYQAQSRETRELVIALGGMLRDSWQAAHAAHVEIDRQRMAQRRELDQAALALREASIADADSEESGARSELIKMVGGAMAQALPLIVQQVGRMLLESQSTVPPPPPAASGE